MNDIQPITHELMMSLPSHERYGAIKRYQKWVRKKRKEDKTSMKAIENRVSNFKRSKKVLLNININYMDYSITIEKNGKIRERLSMGNGHALVSLY